MRGDELEKIRSQLLVSRKQLSDLMGFTGKSKNNFDYIAAMEADRKPISPVTARLAWLILEYRDATGNLPRFPDLCNEEPEIEERKA